jgi:DNA-directed RNA polymerase subunit RPC12/RpoP
MTYNCAECASALDQAPERSEGAWVIRCLACGARNIIVPIFKLVRWQ